MTASELVAGLCRRFEGFRPKPYLCPAGVWTIGYGSTYYLDGRPVRPTDAAISQETAERLLMAQILNVYMPGAAKLCPTTDTDGRTAAIADFAYNLGLTRLAGSTLRKRVAAGDWKGAAIELQKWNRGGGRVLNGLVLRRAAEAALM